MAEKWVNWSGSLSFQPGRFEEPDEEQAVVALVQQAAAEGKTVRVVGAGHSSSRLVETDDLLVSMNKLSGMVSHDPDLRQATFWAGTRLEEVGKALREVGLAMYNLGDVATQTLAGAFATGTHGTGKDLPPLSDHIVGIRLVTGEGEIAEHAMDKSPDFMRAARISLGALGIVTQITLQLVPLYRLRRREWCTHVDNCLAHLDELIAENRNFDFYWYPRSDLAQLRLLNPPGSGSPDLAYADPIDDNEGWSDEIIPKHSGIELKFDEMEYALPIEAGRECFHEVRKRVMDKHRQAVGWRLLYRIVAADDDLLSPYYGRETVTLSLHQNAGLPFEEYFHDIEPVFRAYDGRPHWGKKHYLWAPELRSLYPKWDEFLAVRRRLDPGGVFLSPYLHRLLGV